MKAPHGFVALIGSIGRMSCSFKLSFIHEMKQESFSGATPRPKDNITFPIINAVPSSNLGVQNSRHYNSPPFLRMDLKQKLRKHFSWDFTLKDWVCKGSSRAYEGFFISLNYMCFIANSLMPSEDILKKKLFCPWFKDPDASTDFSRMVPAPDSQTYRILDLDNLM